MNFAVTGLMIIIGIHTHPLTRIILPRNRIYIIHNKYDLSVHSTFSRSVAAALGYNFGRG